MAFHNLAKLEFPEFQNSLPYTVPNEDWPQGSVSEIWMADTKHLPKCTEGQHSAGAVAAQSVSLGSWFPSSDQDSYHPAAPPDLTSFSRSWAGCVQPASPAGHHITEMRGGE